MINFLNLLSKKNKVLAITAADIYVNLLNRAIDEGFIEIKNFINNNNNLDSNPNIHDKDIDWFRNIIFLGNIQNLNSAFEENESIIMRGLILDVMYKDYSENEQPLAIERFLDYENYFKGILNDNESIISGMAYGIFEKYGINKYQGDLFKKKNKPNPIFFNELKNLLNHFIWNWDEYLAKNKVVFKSQ